MITENINITFTKDEAIVLFDFLSRFSSTNKVTIEHQAENVALWNLCSLIEKEISEPFNPEYKSILEKAKENLSKGY
ncbi:MAG TPA: hypothetical protein DHV28_14885 [Ignavibacteriales bacterium]|nr:hypothetical protein [Ignavibacteriales bacterium]